MHYLTTVYSSRDSFVTSLPTAVEKRRNELEESARIVVNKYMQMCLNFFKQCKDEVYKTGLVFL